MGTFSGSPCKVRAVLSLSGIIRKMKIMIIRNAVEFMTPCIEREKAITSGEVRNRGRSLAFCEIKVPKNTGANKRNSFGSLDAGGGSGSASKLPAPGRPERYEIGFGRPVIKVRKTPRHEQMSLPSYSRVRTYIHFILSL